MNDDYQDYSGNNMNGSQRFVSRQTNLGHQKLNSDLIDELAHRPHRSSSKKIINVNATKT